MTQEEEEDAMRIRSTLTLTLAAALAVALPGAGAATTGAGPSPAFAQQVKPEELAADFENSMKVTLANSVRKYEDLWKWCNQKKLSWTAIAVRRNVLRYDPNNEEVRKYVGYSKTPDGMWIRNDARRDQIREEADLEDPKAMKYPERLAAVEKEIVNIWKGLANKAGKNAKDDVANEASWTEKASTCWERVLEVSPTNEDAHKALKHPKHVGKYVRPEALPYLKARDERKAGGGKRAQLPFTTAQVEPDGLFKAAGLTGGGAKSERFVVNSVHGKDHAARMCVVAERALVDFITVYGAPEDLKDRAGLNKFDIVKDHLELGRVLQSAGWDAARIAEFLKYFGGTGLQPGQRVGTLSSGQDSDDNVAHMVTRSAANAFRQVGVQEIGNPIGGIEDWLEGSIAYDVTRRLLGTSLTVVGDFGKYGTETTKLDKDIWMELARMFVMNDDDPELKRLVKCTYQDQNIRVPEIVKGYAIVQYLFESDAEKARKFILTAIVQGTPRAVEAVYGVSMDELDAGYRKWILQSW